MELGGQGELLQIHCTQHKSLKDLGSKSESSMYLLPDLEQVMSALGLSSQGIRIPTWQVCRLWTPSTGLQDQREQGPRSLLLTVIFPAPGIGQTGRQRP